MTYLNLATAALLSLSAMSALAQAPGLEQGAGMDPHAVAKTRIRREHAPGDLRVGIGLQRGERRRLEALREFPAQ